MKDKVKKKEIDNKSYTELVIHLESRVKANYKMLILFQLF